MDCVRVGLLFENGTFPDMKPPEQRLPCPALYKTMPVHNDGTVIICCLDGFKNTNVGNVFEDGVKAVWNGEEFAKVRYYHDQPMGQSSVLQELQRHVIPNGLTGQVSRSRTAERVVAFYNKRGTCEQWIKEGKGARDHRQFDL